MQSLVTYVPWPGTKPAPSACLDPVLTNRAVGSGQNLFPLDFHLQVNAQWPALIFLSVCLFNFLSPWERSSCAFRLEGGKKTVINRLTSPLGLTQGAEARQWSGVWLGERKATSTAQWALMLLLGPIGACLEGLNLFPRSKIIKGSQHRGRGIIGQGRDNNYWAL